MSQKQNSRREKISFLLSMGYQEESIAKDLGVSRRTIVRDVKYLKDSYRKWGLDKLKNDLMFETRLGLDVMKNMRIRLYDLLEEASTFKEKMEAIRELSKNNVAYMNFIFNGPILTQVEEIVQRYLPRDIDDPDVPMIPDHVIEMYTNKE